MQELLFHNCMIVHYRRQLSKSVYQHNYADYEQVTIVFFTCKTVCDFLERSLLRFELGLGFVNNYEFGYFIFMSIFMNCFLFCRIVDERSL